MNVPRVALVTGCGRPGGVGQATAIALANKGVAVMVTDVALTGARNQYDLPDDELPSGGLQDLVDMINANGGVASLTLGDVSLESDVARLVDDTISAYSRIDILVNNAAAPQGGDYGFIDDIPLQEWERVLAINLRGPFLLSRAAVRHMRAQRWGRIINVASLTAKSGFSKQAVYSASKAGLLGLTRALAVDEASSGVTVNAVCPGYVETTRTLNSLTRSGKDIEEEKRRRASAVPVGRLARGEDIAALIAFLASEEAEYITGQAYNVDGGMLMA